MTFEEFQMGAAKLQRVYGEKAYPQERVEIIFRSVKYSSSKIWEETVTELIGEAMHAPPLSKIKETLYAVKKKFGESSDAWEGLRQQLRKLEQSSGCRKCFGQGVFLAMKRADPYQYQYNFICDCHAGTLAQDLPENKRLRAWDMIIARDWRHDFEAVPDAPPNARQEARKAFTNVFQQTDLNVAVHLEPAPKRGVKSEHWETER